MPIRIEPETDYAMAIDNGEVQMLELKIAKEVN